MMWKVLSQWNTHVKYEKVLSQKMHMWNMKVVSLVAHKLWQRLKFLSMDDAAADDDGALTIVLQTFIMAN